MKKTILMVAAATLALTSCSNGEDVTVNNGTAIDFRAAMAMNSRSTDGQIVTTGNLGTITVSAFKGTTPYFKGVDFSKMEGATNYTSATKYYWPSDGSTITFWATRYGQTGAAIASDGITYTGYSIASAINDQIDLVAGTTTGSKSNETTGADLPFKHLLSQIEVKAKCSSSDFTVKVKGVRIARVYGTANGTFSAFTNAASQREGKAEWTGHSGAKLYYNTTPYASGEEIPLTGDAVSVMGADGNAILMPQPITSWIANPERSTTWTDNGGAYIALNVQIMNKVEGETTAVQIYPATEGAYGWTAVPVTLPEGATSWEPGKKYIYTLDFANGAGYVEPGPDPDPENPGHPVLGDPIKFKVTVEGWTDAPVDTTL